MLAVANCVTLCRKTPGEGSLEPPALAGRGLTPGGSPIPAGLGSEWEEGKTTKWGVGGGTLGTRPRTAPRSDDKGEAARVGTGAFMAKVVGRCGPEQDDGERPKYLAPRAGLHPH